MKRFILWNLLIFLLPSILMATYFDTGWKKFEQPDGTTFIGRGSGDEYEFEFVTEDGFAFDLNEKDQYFYYASDVKENRYILTELRVGLVIFLTI